MRPKERSGEGVLLTLLARLTLGVVVKEVTVSLSNRGTPFQYPVSNFPCKVILRELLPFKKFKIENFVSVSSSAPRPKRQKTRLIALASRNELATCGTDW